MPYQEPSMCGRLSWAEKLCGLAAVLGLLLLPPGKAAWGQMPAEGGSQMGGGGLHPGT